MPSAWFVVQGKAVLNQETIMNRSVQYMAVIGMVALLGACKSYVKRDEFEARTAGIDARIGKLESRLDALEVDLKQRFAAYDAKIASFEGKVRVDLTTHFAYDSAALNGADQAPLQEFAEAISQHHPNALITVEGFTDPAGSVAYNRRLGLARANAVKSYLQSQGVNSTSLRAISYGEDVNRQVKPGAWGDSGKANRRVALVVEMADRES
jgi:peptidoglycan-associated lipoprotein